MSNQIKKKHAVVLVIFTLALFIIPVITMIYEPIMGPDTFDRIGKYWKFGGSGAFLLIVLWVLITGMKDY